MAQETRVKPREIVLTLRQRVAETRDSATLVFDRPDGSPPYQAGQFLTLSPHQFPAVRPWLAHLEATKKRKELVRAYSMSSAPHEPDLAVTVKEEPYTPGVQPYPPLLSPYLVHGIAPGTPVKAVCFTGPYVLPPDIEERTDHVLHVVAGSGAIPNFSIVKESLHGHRRLRHTFLYSNKTWEDICFREALAELERAHPDRLSVVHTLTRETDEARLGPRIRKGRVSRETLAEFLPDPSRAYVYVCGPAITTFERRAALESGGRPEPRFLESVLDYLEQLKVPKNQVKREAYG
jgi:3-ketosteroid 9alpha-monooxygenase subunit B